MKIGYPCVTRTLPVKSSHTFRLKSFSEDRFYETVEKNLSGLQSILSFNLKHGLLFFRISSDLIPFASHSINSINWQKIFQNEFRKIGTFITKNKMRISMHPDQFTLINSPNNEIFNRSINELLYHSDVLDLLGLDTTAKIQIHVGGVYGDKTESMRRFVSRFFMLAKNIRERLVIENDDRLYSIKDCIALSEKTGIPVLFDSLHHECLNNGETFSEALDQASMTWQQKDGIPMIDYSQQQKGKRIGNHIETIDMKEFKTFLNEVSKKDFDMMCEIKDKELSAIPAQQFVSAHFPIKLHI